jgi:hypothetical protein
MRVAGSPVHRRFRAWRAAAGAVALVIVGSGCASNPHIASGTFAQQGREVVAIVNATGNAIGAPAEFKPVTEADPLPCYKKMFGYTVKHLAANQAEIPTFFKVSGGTDGASLLPRVEKYWKSKSYAVDRSGLSDHRYPKLRTHIGADLLVVTGYTGVSQMNLYAVSPCVRS